MQRHLSNDWLAATWILCWLTAFASAVSACACIISLIDRNPVSVFVSFCTYVYRISLALYYSPVCSFADCLMFLAGSVYFVAGSYPLDYNIEESVVSVNAPLLNENTSDLERSL